MSLRGDFGKCCIKVFRNFIQTSKTLAVPQLNFVKHFELLHMLSGLLNVLDVGYAFGKNDRLSGFLYCLPYVLRIPSCIRE